MEANAPEKIWVHELSANELNVPLKEYHVEYTRTDAFINKACEWFEKNWSCYTYPSSLMFEDFRKYMKK